ncbi:MAG: ABC transporter permease [Leptolyngbya sp. SIO3F4]|nr:ABC transporter permease [Leptolyngbya sp. SIO3F4]
MVLPSLDVKKSGNAATTVLLGISGWCFFLLVWAGLSTTELVPAQLLPSPWAVLVALYHLFAEKDFLADVLQSVFRILSSYGIAVLVAIPLGLLMGTFPLVEAFLNPLVSPFRYLPAPSFVPLLLMWFGTGEAQKIALLFLGVIWFLITLIMDNAKAVRMELVETAKTLGAGRRTILRTIIFRSALPAIFDTLRQMLAVSWTYLVIAEIVAATDGIGAMMMRAKRFVQVDEIMAGILMIGILGLLFDWLMRVAHRQLFPYLYREKALKS